MSCLDYRYGHSLHSDIWSNFGIHNVFPFLLLLCVCNHVLNYPPLSPYAHEGGGVGGLAPPSRLPLGEYHEVGYFGVGSLDLHAIGETSAGLDTLDPCHTLDRCETV